MSQFEATFDMEVMHSLDKLALTEAIDKATKLIKDSRTKANKKAALLRDISRAQSSREVSRIMWATQLAGDGMSMIGSTWQKMYKGK